MNQRFNGFSTDFTKSKYKFNSLSVSTEKIVPTSHPLVFCTKLPQHWRSNKSLPALFQVMVYQSNNRVLPIGDGHRVWLSASNPSMNSAVLRNFESKLVNGEARFNDLRFISRSGRGKYFDVYIHIECNPKIIAVYTNAIKVTVDGPREPRNKHKNFYFTKNNIKIPNFIPKSEPDSHFCYSGSPGLTDPPSYWSSTKTDTKNLSENDSFEQKSNLIISPSLLYPYGTPNGCHFSLPQTKQDNFSMLQFMLMATTLRIGLPLAEIYNSQSHQRSPVKEIKDFDKTKIWRPF
uniref:Runt-1 n=1 Tax=Schmidtea mediterranea TaxID=79327 RepID=G1C1Q3_SCHMD|nr:runt-like 1 protein [Schmidtea mediterranea]AFJ24721.1 runt-1 [Schmidtea mediterranea]